VHSGYLIAGFEARTLPVSRAGLYRRLSLKEEMDASSFEQIFESYGPRLRAYFLRHGLSGALADEAAQEVLLSVWHHSERFDAERGSMSAWIFAIARNRLIDSVRRMRRPEPSADDPCWVGGNEAPSPESATAARGRVELVQSALKSLPAEQLKVLEALYFEGQSMSEYADASGTPLGTVKTRARLALKALRGRVPEGGEE
jgi:RNA polymerase sigma-70 factor (ECF subfamily)